MNKQELRKYYKNKRASLDKNNIADLSLAIANKALEMSIWHYTNYHIFLPITSKAEVDTTYLLHILQGKDKSIILSKSNFKNHTLQHFLLQENTKIRVSNYGIPEPENGIEIPVHIIDVVFIPLLAFDENGNRIGYGKGFYDTFLKECKPETLCIGISFFEAVKSIPNEPHDIPLHFCITPTTVYTFCS